MEGLSNMVKTLPGEGRGYPEGGEEGRRVAENIIVQRREGSAY